MQDQNESGGRVCTPGRHDHGRDGSPGWKPACEGFGIALIAAGGALIVKNMRYLKNPELLKKGQVAEDDERNRLLGLRCWAYTGYAMFLVLYVGMLIGGFISPTVVVVLQTVLAVYALLLLVFRTILARCM